MEEMVRNGRITPSCAVGNNYVEEMDLLATLDIQLMWKKLVFALALAD